MQKRMFLANVFNNLMVNCKFRAQTPSYNLPNDPEEGYASASVIDYNYYASGNQKSDIVFNGEKESGVAYAWKATIMHTKATIKALSMPTASSLPKQIPKIRSL